MSSELILFPRLSTRSKRALQRYTRRYGHPYDYQPRGNLLARLAAETGMSLGEVYNQLMKERKILRQLYGERTIVY